MHARRCFVATLLTLGICVPIIVVNLFYVNDKKGIRSIDASVNTNANLTVQSNLGGHAAINSKVTHIEVTGKKTKADIKNASLSGNF